MPNTRKNIDNIEINETTNIVSLVGEIISTPVYSHTYDEIPYYSIRLQVNRNHSSKHDNLHVFLPKDSIIMDSVILDSGIRIRVKGKLVQSELCDMSDISVVATQVDLVDSDIADENLVYLSGNIHRLFDLKSIKDSKRVVKQMIIKNLCEDKPNSSLTAKISCWNNIGRFVDDKYAEGDKIFIRGQLESKLVKLKNPDESEKRSSIILHEVAAAVIIDFVDN